LKARVNGITVELPDTYEAGEKPVFEIPGQRLVSTFRTKYIRVT